MNASDNPARPAGSADLPTPSLEKPREKSAADYAHIPGWGADLDRAQRPAVPRERKPPRLEGVHWQAPEQQAPTVEVLRSLERPALTPVFGTTVPPCGASGRLRRAAFRYSENDLRHWLLLLAADRVNVIEGIAGDLARGHFPNVLAEMGARAEIRHNPAGAVRKALVAGALLGFAYLWLRRRPRRSGRRH